MAQLMRVFVAVPEGPVEVHLRPMVQPAPAPCPAFHPGKDALVVPPGDMWVLRLPYPFLQMALEFSEDLFFRDKK